MPSTASGKISRTRRRNSSSRSRVGPSKFSMYSATVETIRSFSRVSLRGAMVRRMSMQSGGYRDMSVPRPGKNLFLAYILWFLLGFLGAHRYYVGQYLKGLLFLVGTIAATALSVPNIPATRIAGAIIVVVLFVFWIIDAFKLRKLVEAVGLSPSATNE